MQSTGPDSRHRLRWENSPDVIADPSPLRLGKRTSRRPPAQHRALTLRLHNGTALPLAAFKLAMSGMLVSTGDAGRVGREPWMEVATLLSPRRRAAEGGGIILALARSGRSPPRRIKHGPDHQGAPHLHLRPEIRILVFRGRNGATRRRLNDDPCGMVWDAGQNTIHRQRK